MINIKNFDSSKLKIDQKSYKNILIYCMGYVTVKSLSYVTINTAIPLYLTINKISGYIEESNRNKYLMQVSTDECKGTLKINQEDWKKNRNVIRSIASNAENYDEKNRKAKSN